MMQTQGMKQNPTVRFDMNFFSTYTFFIKMKKNK